MRHYLADKNIFKITNDTTDVSYVADIIFFDTACYVYDLDTQPVTEPKLFSFQMRKHSFLYKLSSYNEQNIRVYDKSRSTQVVRFELFGSSFSPQFVDKTLGNLFDQPWIFNKKKRIFEKMNFQENSLCGFQSYIRLKTTK